MSLLVSLFYALWEFRLPFFRSFSPLGWLVPVAFLLLFPLFHRLRVQVNFHPEPEEEGLGGSLRFVARLLPLEDTLCFPKRSRWFALGCAVLLAADLAGSWGEALLILSGQGLPYWAALLLNQISGCAMLLLPVLHWRLHRDRVSAWGDIFFAGTMILLGGIYEVHHTLSDPNAYFAALGRYALVSLLLTLAYAGALALYLRWRRRGRALAA